MTVSSRGSGVVVVPGTNWFWCQPRHMAPLLDRLEFLLPFDALMTVGSVLMKLLSRLSVLCHLKPKEITLFSLRKHFIATNINWGKWKIHFPHDISISTSSHDDKKFLLEMSGYIIRCQISWRKLFLFFSSKGEFAKCFWPLHNWLHFVIVEFRNLGKS